MLDKQAYISGQRDQINKWREMIDELRPAADREEEEKRAEINRRIADLHFKLKFIERRLLELKLSSALPVAKVEGKIDAAWDELSKDFSIARTAANGG